MIRMKKEKKVNGSWFCSILALFVVFSSLIQLVNCQVNGVPSSPFNTPDASAVATQLLYAQFSNSTNIITDQISNEYKFCVINKEDDWNRAFNFSSNLDFVSSCVAKTNGDFTNRICTAAEIKFYFIDLFAQSGSKNYVKLNKNCNLTSWNSGCEPGWACRTDSDEVDLTNSTTIPARTSDCQACCEGFFCPSGIACMIPCPLGSYCPLATLNSSTGVCEPYAYQLPPGKPNHTCGGANIWADYGKSQEVFCSPGSYCPATIQKNNCSSGSYCRTGSTSQKRCFKLISCDANSTTQNIRAYGIMLIVALSTLLFIIYSCSDQVLTIRERRLAKSRERAAKSAKETARARERWKAAKIAAKNYASGIQNHFSQTFSPKRKRIFEDPEELKILSETRPETDDDSYLPVRSSTRSPSEQSTASSREKQKEPTELVDVIPDIEDQNTKKRIPKGREMHNRSRIFKNTYAQLEKEKALQEQNKNLTFSGVISMTTDTEIRRRPPIEIEFKNLTLTLKGKKKHLLRCVTGNIRPGRITAVMGPSGAGKTTFLSALVGKKIGCSMTGSILVNGKHESIHSYKKIIGFVPQDDIVHGNLTVEENLWFSARCRLSANLTKADKVLIVERVIESLGLHGVRDSLVGTVEKRGISGGQRKRVNVGIEMVIEPSLLILDEPTSGLDSSTSQLLLRALRRETHEGVNVCMVIHQPSYALFNMFDDLILLAKGGFTAYHGSVKEVEEYFLGLGITIPEKVNPPDHFIDVLEGVVKPGTSSSVSYSELPVRWMLHNGYPVPDDLKTSVSGLTMSSPSATATDKTDRVDDAMTEHSFAGELWQDVKSNVGLQRDKILHNYLKTKDLSKRRTPGVFQQYKYFLGRVGKQRLREARMQAIDYLILLLAGACLGLLAKASEETFGAQGYTYTVIAVSLLCKIAALRSFSLEKLQYWRESASGISSLAYFLAKDTIDYFNTVVKPVVYLSMFHFFSNPRSSFAENYVILLCLVYCVTGIAYALTIFLQPGAAQLCSVILPVVMTLIASRPNDGKALKIVANLCYTKWALEGFVIANARRYYGVWLITRCGALYKSGYDLHDWGLCIAILILTGVISRIVAFLGMVTFQKK